MPNHIISEVEIKGTKEQIAKLIKDTKIILDNDTDKNQFDFNGIIKMPEELDGIASPTKIVETQEEADKVNEGYSEGPFSTNYQTAITKAKQQELLSKYRAINWYDWCTKNWGTKWNAYEVRYITHNDTTLVLKLETAWDTPTGIWEALRERGYEVNGFMHGEMDGYDEIGDKAWDSFSAYQEVTVEYHGDAI